ncbi:MAG: ATP-binding protein [Vigna little leaf phytoplasma]|nr:ATP-binding protein [Vigna little leaf phytoplasma]
MRKKDKKVFLINFIIVYTILFTAFCVISGLAYAGCRHVVKLSKSQKDIQISVQDNETKIEETQERIQKALALISNTKEQIEVLEKNSTNKNSVSASNDNQSFGGKFEVSDSKKFPSFDKLIGMNEAKLLAEPFLNYIQDKAEFEKHGKVEISDGLLMYGVGGTGKTVFARSLAKEADLPFFEVSCSVFSQPYKGQAPAMVKKLFETVRKKAKEGKGCILFLDEAESIFLDIKQLPKESDIRNVVNEYKKQLEDEKDPEHPIFVVAATNNLQDIDSAILSRFAHRIEIKPGDFEERVQQLRFILEKTHQFPINSEAKDYLLNVINRSLDALSSRDNYKRAYRVLLKLLNTANQQCINRCIKATKQKQVCQHSKHEELILNNIKCQEQFTQHQVTDKDILGNGCVCQSINIEDLEFAYQGVIDRDLTILNKIESDRK